MVTKSDSGRSQSLDTAQNAFSSSELTPEPLPDEAYNFEAATKAAVAIPATSDPQVLWPDETWKDIPGYEGLYLVSDHGQIWCIAAQCLSLLHSDKKGGNTVKLVRDGVTAWPAVQLVVAQTYVENTDPIHKTYVGHLNGQRMDNRADNLVWLHKSSLVEQLKEATNKLKRQQALSPLGHLTREDVLLIKEALAVGVSIRAIAREFGVSQHTIYAINRGDHYANIKLA